MTGKIQHIQNEEYYKLVADNINDLVAVYSVNGILEYLSPSVTNVLGYSEGSLNGTNARHIIHPDDLHLLNLQFAPSASSQVFESISFEYRLLHKNGHWIHFESYRKPIRDGFGNLLNILAVCRDITTRKKAEQALRDNEAYYRMLADNIIDMVAVYSMDGTTLYVSPSCQSLLGYTANELTGSNIIDIVHPGDIIRFRNDIRLKAFKGIEKFTTEARLLHKDGTWRYCETTTKAMRDANGLVQSFIGTTRDITEWKLAQVALIESEEKYRSLVESSDALIAIIDLEGHFLFVNDKRAEFFNMPKHTILGKSVYDFYSPEDTTDFKDNVNTVCTTRQSLRYEAQVKLKHREAWLSVTMHPVFDAEGEVKNILVNSNDITSAKEKEEVLRAQNNELKQIAFLQSHIVRSPLTNIQGIIALMEDGELNPEQAYYLNLLKQATTRLDSVVKEIVDRAVLVRHHTMDV